MTDEKRDWLVLEAGTQLWWRDNRCGYTSNLLATGLYTEGEAKSIQEFSDRYGRQDKAMHISAKSQEIDELMACATRLFNVLYPDGILALIAKLPDDSPSVGAAQEPQR